MPRYNNYFRSHIFPGDPRTPLTAAGACQWPTFPAHRYELKSDNATGVLSVLNTTGILIEKVTPGQAHDDCQWNMISGPVPVLFCVVWKRAAENYSSWIWQIGISVTGCGIMEKEILIPTGPCNTDFVIGHMNCEYTSDTTGSHFKARQVVFDKSTPPTYP